MHAALKTDMLGSSPEFKKIPSDFPLYESDTGASTYSKTQRVIEQQKKRDQEQEESKQFKDVSSIYKLHNFNADNH